MNNFGKTFLLLGPESGEKSVFIKNLKAAVMKDKPSEMEVSKYYPFETGMSSVVSSIRNGSLFSDCKWVEIAQVDGVKREEAAILGEYIKNPSPDTVLILTSDLLARDIAKPIVSAVPKDRTKIFWELFESQKQSWVRGYFSRNGIRPEDGVVELILELVENNTEHLKKECEKLVLFLNGESILTSEEVEKYIYHSREENVFTLFDRIASGDLGSTLEVFRKISLSGDTNPVQLVSGLLWQFRRVLELGILVEQHISFDEACRNLRISGKRLQNIYRQAIGNYNIVEMERIVAMTADLDGELRNGRAEIHTHMMDMYFYHLIVGKGQKKSRTDYRL
ncbi:MAG: DNA polymerase III subunit delta [Spirochaetales bacterium]|nr:DNA polymerase III subunit delta [Spirochaetales bacterium]